MKMHQYFIAPQLFNFISCGVFDQLIFPGGGKNATPI